MILLEAKREPSSEQAEMLHVPSTSSSTSALGTMVVGASGISVLETLRGENMALQQENHLLSARIQKLEAENARLKKDQRECLEKRRSRRDREKRQKISKIQFANHF